MSRRRLRIRRKGPRVRRHRALVPNFLAGLLGIAFVGVISYLVFGGSVPFTGSPFVLRAQFTSATQLHIPSPVRIAGVDVGQIVSVERISNSSSAAVVTMNIERNGLPIHADATVSLRPRIFLEGNFYADLRPGTPAAPDLNSGATLPAANTSGPVQLDRVLSALNSDARANLQTLLQGIGSSLNAPATGAQDASQDPIVRGLTGGQSLNLALKYSTDAFRASAVVNQALLGIQPHDLSRVVSGNEQIFRGLAASGRHLSSFVTTFNATMAALASRQQALSATIAALPPWLQSTDNALGPLNSSFAPTREFARALLPGVKQLGPTIEAGIPWLTQSQALLSPSELGGLLSSLTPAVQETSSSLTSTKDLLSTADSLARCFVHNLVPTGNEVIADPPLGTGRRVYQELFQSTVGLASSAQNFDGNGRFIRATAGGGSNLIKSSPVKEGFGPLYGNAVLPLLGTRPAWPGRAPPLRRDVPCYKNPAPDLNRVVTGGTP